MNSFTRAVLYLKRHPIKSVILTGLFVCISLALGVLIALNTTLEGDIKRLSDQQDKQFLLTKIEEGLASLPTSSRLDLEKVMSEHQLLTRSLVSEEVAIAIGQSENSRSYSLVNYDFFEKSQVFEEQFVLETGSYLTVAAGQALVSRAVADKYELSVGDTITVRSKNGQELGVEVVGIFRAKQHPFAIKESDAFENNLLTTTETIERVNPNVGYHTVMVDAESKTMALQSQMAFQTDEVLYQTYQIKPNSLIQAQLKMLKNQQQFLKMVIGGILILSHLILLCFLHLWMKGRQLEIGILQSLGNSRLEIVLQYVIEVLLLALLTSVLGLFVVSVVLAPLRDSLMQDILKTTYENVDNGEFLPAVFSANSYQLKELLRHPVGITVLDSLVIIASVLVLSVGAVLISCFTLLKYSPKKIFSMMS